MAKKIISEAPAAEATTSARAIVKSKYDALMRTIVAGERERASDAGTAREKIGEHVEKHNLHAKAFSMTKTLKKMPIAKRDELIFHLMTYFKYEGWPGEDLLADRQPGQDHEAEEARGAGDGEPPAATEAADGKPPRGRGARLDPPEDDDGRGRPSHLPH